MCTIVVIFIIEIQRKRRKKKLAYCLYVLNVHVLNVALCRVVDRDALKRKIAFYCL